MSRRLMFHYARPDGKYDDWDLVATNGATVEDRQDGPFGVLWPVELHDDATAFTYQLQRGASATKYGANTDPAGNKNQTIPLEQDDTEVLYPSGFTRGKTAHTLPITSPDAELQAIRETVNQVVTGVESVHDAVTIVDSKVTIVDGKADTLVRDVAEVDRKVGVVDGKANTLTAAAVEVRDDVRGLLSDVIIVGQPANAPDDVGQLVLQSLPVVTDVITALEAARTTFAWVRRVPLTPGGSRGQAAEQIVERLFAAQLDAQEQRDRLKVLADDGAARGAQDLVALRAQLRASVDLIDRRLEQVRTLTQPDPADLELFKILDHEVRPKLTELRVLAAEVSS
jgi:hypothetical protein